ncbi:hypothetical protein RISK_002580 [Rhodopirellula islandica]|uniref:Uncharacterized protein n=1 Tax=Rhodopirellula islandica TaxID=595434 RepID=A0A0J1BFK3_RHOIS|nr:hypothetical protein RISK_002580 [Rhodopirellula islandica]
MSGRFPVLPVYTPQQFLTIRRPPSKSTRNFCDIHVSGVDGRAWNRRIGRA